MNTQVFKEPRGVNKILQFVLAIFAFATTCSVVTQQRFTVHCPTGQKSFKINISYPFNLEENTFSRNVCDAIPKNEIRIPANYMSASQFYVFIGVMAFLYSIGATILYVVFSDNYENNEKIPIADFIISCVFVLMWLISSSAWADGVNSMKHYTDPDKYLFLKFAEVCHPDNETVKVCVPNGTGDFATLNVSLIFGFANMALWAASLWFLWKETKWHHDADIPPPAPTGPTGFPESPQAAETQY